MSDDAPNNVLRFPGAGFAAHDAPDVPPIPSAAHLAQAVAALMKAQRDLEGILLVLQYNPHDAAIIARSALDFCQHWGNGAEAYRSFLELAQCEGQA